jgi:hypothetical protein
MPHDRGLTGALIMFLNPIGPPNYVVDNWRHPVDVTATYSGYDVIVAVGEIPMDGGPDLGPEQWGLVNDATAPDLLAFLPAGSALLPR